MKPENQIKALAELGGLVEIYPHVWLGDRHNHVHTHKLDYLTSYDAIIPVIQKQSKEIRAKALVAFYFNDINTPAQLCEALLRATGKWKE